jgi:hypothetical protein
MKIKVVSGPPGCGKTWALLSEMIEHPGRYILASPRIDLIKEREHDLKTLAAASKASPLIRMIYSGQSRPRPVPERIVEAIDKHQNDEHVILLITHEGMMSADLDNLAGWHVKIDEMPLAVVTDNMRVQAGAVYFEQTYELDPVTGTKWSKLKVRDDGPGTRSVLRDDLMKTLGTLDKRARSAQGIYADVQDWADLRLRGRTLQWWSVWTPLQLQTADSVTIAGASYHHSILAKVIEALYPGQIEIEEVHITGRPRQPRRVLIHYFTQAHRGASTFWEGKGKGKGHECLAKVCRNLEKQPIGFWSGNEVVTDYFYERLSGDMVAPKAEGTNSLMHHKSCAFIYSSKPLESDKPLINVFGLNKEEIERAREVEDVIQFVFRGDLRNPDATGDYNVYLYDRYQAEALAAYLTEHGLGMVELVPVEEAGLLDMQRPGRGRPPSEPDDPRSLEERKDQKRADDAARQKRQRDRKKEEKIRNGTYQPPGPPKKVRHEPPVICGSPTTPPPSPDNPVQPQ